MIQFKASADTNPGKLASAIAHNIKHSDIEVTCAGTAAVNQTVKALIIAKKYTQNEDFTLKFDFFSLEETTAEGTELYIIKAVIMKEAK